MSTKTADRADDMYLSREQQHEFTALMVKVQWIVQELDVTLTRQSQFGNKYETGKSTETPVYFHEQASEIAYELHGTVVAWVNEVATQRGLDHPGVSRTAVMARWLWQHAIDLALIEEAETALDELTDAVRRAQHVVDRPAGRIYVGPCGNDSDQGKCGADLYASLLKPLVKCQNCGATHVVEERRKALQEQVRGLLGSAAEIAKLLPWVLDSPITRKRITYYANRGAVSRRLMHGETVYQIGEVIDAHVDFEARRRAAA